MERKPIPSQIGFADGEVESYRKDYDVLEVVVKAWNEQRIRVIFHSVVRMLDNDAGDLEALCEVTEETDFLRAAIHRVYDVIPSEVPYRHFQFVSLEGDGALDVVAEQITIVVEAP